MGLIFFLVLCGLWGWIAVIDVRYYLIDRLLCLLVVLVFGAYLLINGIGFWLHLAIGLFYWVMSYILHFMRPRMIGAGDCELIGTCFFVFGVDFLLLGAASFVVSCLGVFSYYCWRRGKWGLKHGFPLGLAAAISVVFITGAIIFEIPLEGKIFDSLILL